MSTWRFFAIPTMVVLVAAVADAGFTPEAQAAEATLIAAGDIASCSSSGDEATELLLDLYPTATVATLGDNAYESGSPLEYMNCYDPTWGQHKTRTKPSAGNHEYNTPGATGYYAYFGADAGDPAKGYYSYTLGDWHVIVINSNCSAIGGCGAGSPQEQWLRADLEASGAACTLAYWHHPRFSSGSNHGSSTATLAIWQALYDYRAEIVLSGHEHNYERFAPQTPSGGSDPAYGIREFVVGTGGKSHYGFNAPIANSEVRNGDTYGVLKLSLHDGSYDWEFVHVAGQSFTDTGSGVCQGGDWDFDNDGVFIGDNCPDDVNPSQQNNDRDFVDLPPSKSYDDVTWPASDLLGDACDDNDDNDGLPDAVESPGPPCGSGMTNPMTRDSDGDRVLDGTECTMGTNPGSGASTPSLSLCQAPGDADGDGVFDARESCYYGSSTSNADSDLDGLNDDCEIASINGDRAVNVIDLQQVAQHTPQGAQGYLVEFDLNKDGQINVLDLQFVAARSIPCP